MSDQYILSFDPGVSSGAALGKITDTEPYQLVQGWQFSGGLRGFLGFLDKEIFEPYEQVIDWPRLTGDYRDYGDCHTVSEKFVPLQGKGFSLTLDAVEPLKIEGAMIALGVMPDYSPSEKRWSRPNSMYFCGGATLPEKKKRSRAFLKATGNYKMPKELGTPDSDDFLSATLHGVAYAMKTLKNRPTFQMVTD